MALLEGVGETATRTPGEPEFNSTLRTPETAGGARVDKAARAPDIGPEREAPEASDPELDPAAHGDPRLPAAPVERPTEASRGSPEVLRTFQGPLIDSSAGSASDGKGDNTQTPAQTLVASAPPDSSRGTGGAFDVVSAPEGSSSQGERILPETGPPRGGSVPVLSREANVLFESEGLPPGADPFAARRGISAFSFEPRPAPTHPTPPAIEESPPGPPPGLQGASSAAQKPVLSTTPDPIAGLERVLGIRIEEVMPSDAGVSSDTGGGSNSSPFSGNASTPAPVSTTAPVLANAANSAPQSDAAALRVEVGGARRGAGLDTLTASSRGVSRSDAIDRAEFIERVVRAARLARQQGGARIKIVLRPPELGRLRVELSVRNNVLNVRIGAEQPGASELVQSNLGALRESLESQGVRVGELIVTVDGDAQGSQPQNGADRNDPSFEDVANLPADFGREGEPATSEAAVPVPTATLVDLIA